MHGFRLHGRTLVVSLAVLFTALFMSAPAYADGGGGGGTFNDASVTITGGNAHALSLCVNFAKLKAKKGEPAQSNACKNFAKAQGGDVNLKHVDISILQASGTGTSKNNAEVTIAGGDATAVAACVNYLQGSADADQTNKCKNTSVAQGGDVNLKNVDITIIQG